MYATIHDVNLKTEPGQPVPYPGGGMPESVQGWAWIAVSELLRGDVRAPLWQMPDSGLRHLAATIGVNAMILPHLLASWRLPPLEHPGLWAGIVLPAIRAELERRQRPKRTWGADSPISQLKRLSIADVAGRFTELTGGGDKLKGRCPSHDEKSASFYVYLDTNRWWCYGACGSGGYIVDLVQRLRSQGRTV